MLLLLSGAEGNLERERGLEFGIWKLYEIVNLLCLILLNHKFIKIEIHSCF